MTDAARILNVLSSLRVAPQPEEYEIHDMISAALDEAGIDFTHEYRLAPGRRIDFMAGSVGIEVKKGRPQSAVLRKQLARYLESNEINAMIVVLQKPCHLPGQINDKPVFVLALNRLCGVALP